MKNSAYLYLTSKKETIKTLKYNHHFGVIYSLKTKKVYIAKTPDHVNFYCLNRIFIDNVMEVTYYVKPYIVVPNDMMIIMSLIFNDVK